MSPIIQNIEDLSSARQGGVVYIWKRPGETPLQALKRLSGAFSASYGTMPSATYAGRLDPIAQGVLPILFGDAISQKDTILSLPKSYTAKILLGAETDSWDILGLPQNVFAAKHTREGAERVLAQHVGVREYPLPAYASVPVSGKPLHEWARSGDLAQIKIPRREMTFTSISLLKYEKILARAALAEIVRAVEMVKGDFRQKEIVRAWKDALTSSPLALTALTIEVSCKSGAYIRSLAQDIGQCLGAGGCVLALSRTRVGSAGREECVKLPE